MAQPPSATSAPATTGASAPQPSRSHGRGGAGNIGSQKNPAVDAASLVTPTIKSSTYTTGRGGTGNMAQNDPNDPASARLAQDVDTPKAHDREVKGTYHWGRGGEGNMMTVGGGTKVTETEGAAARPSSALRTASRDLSAEQRQGTRRSGSFHAAVEKGKELLGLGSKKEREAQQAASENAIE